MAWSNHIFIGLWVMPAAAWVDLVIIAHKQDGSTTITEFTAKFLVDSKFPSRSPDRMPATSLHPAAKRKAGKPFPYIPQKRHHASTPRAPSPAPSASPSPTEPPPNPLSINAILRKHHRTRLYVAPLQWTSRHLQLLGCRFTPCALASESSAWSDAANTPVPDTQDQPMSPGAAADVVKDAVVEAATHILHTRSPEIKTLAVQALLSAHGFHYTCMTSTPSNHPSRLYTSFVLPFYFNQQIVATLRTEGVFSYSSSTTPTAPCLAYLDLKSLGVRRDKSIKLSSTTSRVNAPITRLRVKYQRRIRPPQEQEDPYIVAILIALAQMQRSQLVAEGRAAAPSGVDTVAVHLLALSTDARSVYFYAGRVPFAFLDGLDHPSRHSPGGSFDVPYHRISLASTEKTMRGLGCALAVIRGECVRWPNGGSQDLMAS